MAVLRNPVEQCRKPLSARGSGKKTVIAHQTVAEVTAISAEKLVAPNAGKNHCYAFARELRNEICGDARGVGHGLIEMPNELWEELTDVRSHDDLMMVGTEGLGDQARIGKLVVVAVFSLISNRISLHGPAGKSCHDCYDRA